MAQRLRHAGGRLFRRKTGHSSKPCSTWWIAYYVDGKEQRESARTTDRAEAQALLRSRLAAVSEGTYTGPERDKLTVAELLEGVILFYEAQGHHSLRTVRGHARVWTQSIGRRRALDVTTLQLRRLTQEWTHHGTSAATINRRLAILRRAYRLAKVKLDPARLDFTDVFLREASPRGRYLPGDGFAAIHAHLPTADLRDAFEFAYLCGTRKQQLLRTTWSHYDPERHILAWQATDTKQREPHVLPLAGRPLEIIEARYAVRRAHCPHVFHGPRCAPGVTPSKTYGCLGDFKRAWETACTKAGFPVGRKSGGFTFHNTRHTSITNLVNAGVAAHEAMAVSGHRTRSVFDRYSIRVEDQTRDALRRATEYTTQLRRQPTKVVPLRTMGSR